MNVVAQRVRLLERHDPLFLLTCVQCGARFEGIGGARFCSRRCVNRADYLRHAEQRRQERRARYRQRAERVQKKAEATPAPILDDSGDTWGVEGWVMPTKPSMWPD